MLMVLSEERRLELNPIGLPLFNDYEELERYALKTLANLDDDVLRDRYRTILHKVYLSAIEVAQCCSDRHSLENFLAGTINYIAHGTGRSINSHKQLSSAFRDYAKYCRGHNAQALPLTMVTTCQYFDHLMGVSEGDLIDNRSKVKYSTLKSRLVFLNMLRKIAKQADNPFDNQEFIDYMRQKSNVERLTNTTEDQASAFQYHHLKALNQIWASSDNLVRRRDLALLKCAYDSLLRESELTQLKVGMLRKDPVTGDYTSILTNVKNTKQQIGKQRTVWISRESMAFVFDVLSELNLDVRDPLTPLFPSLWRSGKCRLTDGQARNIDHKKIDSVFGRAYSVLLPKDVTKTWTGHSARIGRAIDLVMQGATHTQIMHLGGWSSEAMVKRYTAGIDISSVANAFRPS